MRPTRNLWHDRPSSLSEEWFDELVSAPGVKVERIVSGGHATPPGEWYDQEWSEWVALLAGEATLQIEGEAHPRHLGPGDHVLLPARCRHRVERTSTDALWLAVHFADRGPSST
jgi:cupin 2 domain-containing protein